MKLEQQIQKGSDFTAVWKSFKLFSVCSLKAKAVI